MLIPALNIYGLARRASRHVRNHSIALDSVHAFPDNPRVGNLFNDFSFPFFLSSSDVHFPQEGVWAELSDFGYTSMKRGNSNPFPKSV